MLYFHLWESILEFSILWRHESSLIKFHFTYKIIYHQQRLSKEILKKISLQAVGDIKISSSEEAFDYSHCEPVFNVIKISSGKLLNIF